jgi:hypothetical protein
MFLAGAGGVAPDRPAGVREHPGAGPPNVEAATKTLERALISWQKGDALDGMEKASPPLKVFDPKWKSGDKLTKFELQGPGTPKGGQQGSAWYQMATCTSLTMQLQTSS